MKALDNFDKSSDETVPEVPDDLLKLVTLYENSDSMAKLIILSLIDPSKYTKEVLMDIFQCTCYRIDQARKWRASSEGSVIPKKRTIFSKALRSPKMRTFP